MAAQPAATSITITVDSSHKVDVDMEPTVKKGHVLRWECAYPFVVLFDGHPDDDDPDGKFKNGPFEGGVRIIKANQALPVRPHKQGPKVHYKYNVVVYEDGAMRTVDPEVIVDPG